MSTEQIIEEIKKMSPAERAEVEEVLSSLKQKEKAKSPASDFMSSIMSKIEQISEEDKNKLPSDLAGNHDHYLYGAPKK
ncbi:MAG: hypothetical protein HY961_06655 [Ignavibacteriae bacterium]|nr:hypothetical protein [Ignavibacteriota bacterium]